MESNKENQLHIKIWKLILAIIIVNAAGLCLRYFNLSTYIIIIGFRFHISFVLPFIIVFSSDFLPYIKRSFLSPEWDNAFFFLLLIILPLLIEAGGLFIHQKIDIGDPDYFYEFGISSIADYPIYLIWNFPQMILFFFFLVSVSSISKFKFLTVAAVIFFLFAFELVSINKTIIPFRDLGILISCCLIYSILINYYRNIYWFGVSLFTLLWLAILAFGSSSKTMINLLFASQYNNWEGFFEVMKDYIPFTLPVYFGIALIISCITCLFFSKVKPICESHGGGEDK
jgi:hypothetical protein